MGDLDFLLPLGRPTHHSFVPVLSRQKAQIELWPIVKGAFRETSVLAYNVINQIVERKLAIEKSTNIFHLRCT